MHGIRHRGAATGRWPLAKSGPVAAAPGETWLGIDMALRKGRRGLCAGSSLARLLSYRRGVRNQCELPRLTIKAIVAWAKMHYFEHRRWPTKHSGPVLGTLHETWLGIDKALRSGRRGLSGKSTLSKLLRRSRGGRSPP